MKKIIVFWVCLALMVSFVGCSKNQKPAEQSKWDCSITCAEEDKLNEYVITYSDKKLTSQTGVLTFQNRNDFNIVVHLLASGEEERTAEIPAGGVSSLYQIKDDIEYTVGIHADVCENTEIKLMVYDGTETDAFVR